MEDTKHGGRARCALAAGTLVAVLAGTAFAGGAADAAAPAPAATSSLLGAGDLLNGLVGANGAASNLLNGTPVSAVVPVGATVPVTISTGNILGASSSGSGNVATGGTSTTTNSGTTTSSTGPTTSNSGSTTTNSGSTTTNSGSTTSSSGSTTTTTTAPSTTTSTATGPLSQVQLSRSSSTVYPSKDGYGDDITFDVRPLDANGNPVAVVGKAYLVLDGRIVKTYVIDGSTTTITWDGRIDGKIVAGKYSFVLDVTEVATGAKATTTSAFSVSGKKLATTTFVQTRTLKSAKLSLPLPPSVKKALAYGTISVGAKVKHSAHPAVKVTVQRTGKDRVLVIANGAMHSKRVVLPAVSKKVRVVLPKRTAKVGVVAVTYRFKKLG